MSTPHCPECQRWDGTHSGGCSQTGRDYPCSACFVGDFHGHTCKAYDPQVDREHRNHPRAYTFRDVPGWKDPWD